jgi:polygalacturonase
MFHLVANRCEDVLIEGIRVVAPSDAPNTDAIDPSGSRIIIRNCETDTGDDNVAFNGPVRDALVENMTCLHGHGISIGSPTVGGVHHVIVRHCTFDGGDNGIRIKSVRGRGGLTDDIHYSDLQMKNIGRAIDINMLYNGNANTKTDIGPRQADGNTRNVPQVRDVTIENVTITRATNAGRILGLPEFPAHNITLSDVSISADSGLMIQDADLVTLKNVTLNIAAGPALQTDNANVVWAQ